MRIAWLFILALLLAANTGRDELFVITEKEIRVKGVTSIGRFECTYGNEKLSDTLYLGNLPHGKRLDFVIPVEDFGCGNFLLNRDFKATIKADQFPECRVTVKSLIPKRGGFSSKMDVNLAGKSLSLDDVEFRLEKNRLIGDINLSFDELELVAPKKLGGLIQVQDQLSLQIIMGF